MSILSKADRITGALPIAAVESSSVLVPLCSAAFHSTRSPNSNTSHIGCVSGLPSSSIQTTKGFCEKHLIWHVVNLYRLSYVLLGANAGFMEVGNAVGYNIALLDNKGLLILIGSLLAWLQCLPNPLLMC